MTLFPYQILMQMINFLILFLLLNKFLFKPLIAFLDKREASVQASLESAKASEVKAKALITEQTELLNQAKQEARTIRTEAESLAQADRQAQLKKTQQDIQARLQQSQQDINQQLEQAKKELIITSGNLAVSLTEQLISEKLSDSQRDFINKTAIQNATL